MRLRAKHILIGVFAVLALGGTAAAAALAAQPVKGATYSGLWLNKGAYHGRIAFEVSANGKTVSGFDFATKIPANPKLCAQHGSPTCTFQMIPSGGGMESADLAPASAVIRNGAFTATVRLRPKNQFSTTGKLIVKGAFTSPRQVKGTITAKYGNRGPYDQGGTPVVHYTANAK